MKRKMIYLLATIAPLVSSYGQELLTDAGFEDTDLVTGGIQNAWGNFGASGFNDFFGPNAHASFFADTFGNFGGVFQIGIAATEGLEYTFNLTDFFVENNFGGTLSVALEFYEGDDSTQVGSATTLDLSLVAADAAPLAGTLFVNAIAPVGASFVRPLISFADATGVGAGSENFFVFDASLTAVPEPSSMALLFGVASLAFVATRRRQ